MKSLARALVLLTAVCALAASQASAAINAVTVTATNTTPPDEVGRMAVVSISGQVLATSRKKVAQRCRSSRDFNARYVAVGGITKQVDFRATSRTGRFKGDFPLEYGGQDPADPTRTYSGDVDFAGGVVTFTFTFPKTIVKGNKGPFSLFTCKKLTATAQVSIPPASQ